MGILDRLSGWFGKPAAPLAPVPALLSAEQLHAVMPYAGARAEIFLAPLNAAMVENQIDNPKRIAAFLAQLAVESGELRYTRELATGDAYENRRDLGNAYPGDGRRYKGRGLMQITGRENYRRCSVALYGDERLLNAPEYLELPMDAARSAGWYWWVRRLNSLADAGDFEGITKKINGGLNGQMQRVAYWERAKRFV